MATDPVRRVRTTEQEDPGVPDLRAVLSRLAALNPSPTSSTLTASFDWSVDGSEPGRIPAPAPKRSQERALRGETGSPRRPGWQQTQRELQALVDSHGPRGETYDALAADFARITAFVENELDLSANGVFVVADEQQGVFEAIPLDVAPTPSLVLESIPALSEYRPYLLLHHFRSWVTVYGSPLDWARLWTSVAVLAAFNVSCLFVGGTAFHLRDIKS